MPKSTNTRSLFSLGLYKQRCKHFLMTLVHFISLPTMKVDFVVQFSTEELILQSYEPVDPLEKVYVQTQEPYIYIYNEGC